MARGKLFVISGPSGVGKGTVISRVLENDPSIWKSVSATTRAPRKGETDGIDYFFMNREDFLHAVEDGGFLEWAEYAGNLYGTPAKSVEDRLAAGQNVILEIDVQGAFQVRESKPDSILVFIEPPSIEELERRLRQRGSEDEATVRSRMQAAEVELSRKMEYDTCFVNEDIEDTANEIGRFVKTASQD